MDENHCRDIIGLLKDVQKGLTIEEISKKTGLSRITTTKYLSSLFVAGHVDMRKTGPAKVFTLSKRLPVDQILSQSSDLLLILDEFSIVRDISDSFSQMFGIAIEDLKHKNIAATSIGADLFDRIRDPARKGLSGIKSVVNTWIPVGKEWKAFQIRIIPLVFSWGDKGILVEFEDRTDGMMAEEENALLADLVDASPAAIVVYDFRGKVLYSNKKNLNLLGYSLAEFLELDSSRINIPGSADNIAERIKEIRNGEEVTYEVLYCHKDGRHIPLEIHARVVRWGDREVIITIATDISERKKAE
ncbi:MAG: PAS domain S-box protein, partial [Methanoregula sp.]